MNRFHSEETEHRQNAVHEPSHAVTTGRDDPVEAVPSYTAFEAEEDLVAFQEAHQWDPNLSQGKVDAINHAIKVHDGVEEKALEAELIENSPYPEVQAAVDPVDDPDVPANTFRAWFLGMFFITLGSGLNVLFSLREPSISVGSLVAQLCSYPLGVFMAKVLPNKELNIFGWKFNFNPGPFNKKEHALITIMANVSFAGGAAYSTLTIEAQRGFYNKDYGAGFAIMFTLATQMTGLGLAGLVRQFLVYPSSMIWPSVLPNCALFNTLHDKNVQSDPVETNGWKIARFRFFLIVLIAGFVWYWVPGFLWTGLSVAPWVTWIKPKHILVNQLMGGYSGFSLGAPFTVFTLDWTTISGYLGSPLIVPWHALANSMISLFIFAWVMAIGINYSGAWFSDYLPVSTSKSYDNTAHTYNVTRIITPDFRLDLKKYKDYSPIFLSTTFALQYGLSFAAIVAVIVHVGLFHGKEIWMRFRASRSEPQDIHQKLYAHYPEVPFWWFGVMFIVMLGISIASVTAYDMQTPVWALLFSVLLAAFFVIPVGMIAAITNIAIGLNVITEFIIAYWLPGRPMAMMVFKTMGYITMTQALTYIQGQKMGLYMKVAPRTLFWGQFAAALWSCFVQVGVLLWAFAYIPDICTENQKNNFTCPNGRVFFNASIIWGVIGPSRMFGKGSIYESLQWFWLVGAIVPVLFYILARKFPKSGARFLNAPIIFGGLGYLPPAVPMNYLMWGTVGFMFNKWIRDRARGWWMRYNYILSAALDAGLAFGTIVIFFSLTMNNIEPPQWWGNTVVGTTLDVTKMAVRKKLPKGEIFGPPRGSW